MRAIGALLLISILISFTPSSAVAQLMGEADVNHYRNAFEAAETGSWTRARSHANKAEDPTLRHVLIWSYLLRSNNRDDYHTIVDFLDETVGWPDLKTLRYRAEKIMPEDLPTTDVDDFFRRYKPVSGAGILRWIEALLELGHHDDARDVIRAAWSTHVFHASDEKTFTARYKKYLTHDEHVARVDQLIWDRQLRSARRVLPFLDDGQRHLAQARILLSGKNYGVDAAIARIPDALRESEGLLYERIKWRLDRENVSGARELFRSVPRELDYPDLWAILRLRIALALLDDGEYEAAHDIVADHSRRHGAFHHRTSWLAGWIALRFLDNPVQAQEHFSEFHEAVSTPISLARGAYWAGATASAMDDHARADAWYRLAAMHGQTWYGQLAAAALGIMPAIAEPPIVADEDVLLFKDNPLRKVVLQLEQIGRHRLIRSFLLHMAQTATRKSDLHLTGLLARELDRSDLSVQVARIALRKGVVLVHAAFPIVEIGETSGVDTNLVLGVINRESGFDSRAVSGRKALGMMQLLLPTAKEVARSIGEKTSRSRLLNDPDHNIELGTAYLKTMIESLGGSCILALGAYNAGKRNVLRWVKRFGDPRDPGANIDIIDWIERLPYRETRDYIQRVIETMHTYRLLNADPGEAVSTDPRLACSG